MSLERLRWQPVALRHPQRPDDWLVKRLIGLPGETVQIRGGDVFVDGKQLVKSLAQLRKMAVPVCDTRGLPSTAEAAEAAWRRWQPANEPTDWQREGTVWRSVPGSAADWSWLAFQPTELAGYRPPGPMLLDDYPFNLSLSRRLFPVRDLLLRGELEGFHSGQFACRLVVGGERLELVWERSEGWCELRMSKQRPVRAKTARGGGLRERLRWELALCDGQFHFTVEGEAQLTVPLPRDTISAESAVEQLELGVRDTGLSLQNLELLRDVYYLSDSVAGPASDAPVSLGPDELYVLGDNSPVSEDSRQFGPVDARRLLGPVTQWPW